MYLQPLHSRSTIPQNFSNSQFENIYDWPMMILFGMHDFIEISFNKYINFVSN